MYKSWARKNKTRRLEECSMDSMLAKMSETLIKTATEKVTQNVTSIIIAHRISTIINADNILVLDNGISIEYGNFY